MLTIVATEEPKNIEYGKKQNKKKKLQAGNILSKNTDI